MCGAVSECLAAVSSFGKANGQRHFDLRFGVVAAVPPVIVVVLVEFLAVIAGENHKRSAACLSLAFGDGVKHFAKQLVVLIEAVAVKIPEFRGVEVVVKAGVIGVCPGRLEGMIAVRREVDGVGQVVEEE